MEGLSVATSYSCWCGRDSTNAYTPFLCSPAPLPSPPRPSSFSSPALSPSFSEQMNPRVMSIPEMKEYAQELPYRMQAKQQLSKCRLHCVGPALLKLCLTEALWMCIVWVGTHSQQCQCPGSRVHTPAPPTSVSCDLQSARLVC